jgi:hypothetical protein
MKTLESILEIKTFAYEIAKDSPLLLYLAFYEPFHGWLINVAEGWNPVLKFFLNILMVVYGIFRIAVMIKNWNKAPKAE